MAAAGVSTTFCSRSFHPIRCDFVAAFSGRTVAATLVQMGDAPNGPSMHRSPSSAGPLFTTGSPQPPIPTFADGSHLTGLACVAHTRAELRIRLRLRLFGFSLQSRLFPSVLTRRYQQSGAVAENRRIAHKIVELV